MSSLTAELEARALLLHDLQYSGVINATVVSTLEEVLAQRSWWLSHWPQGRPYITGLVAQDLQDALRPQVRYWPVCPDCVELVHSLRVDPEIGGPDPTWNCEVRSRRIAAVGHLPRLPN